MKILQVIDRLNIGGAERVMLDITRLLIEKNINVGVLLFNDGYPLDKDIDSRAELFILNRQSKYSLSKLHKAHRICSNYDIVHVHMRHCYAYIRLAQLLFGGKYKLILHDHYGNIEIDKSVSPKLKSIFKPQYYIGVSNTLAEWANMQVGVPESNIHLLENSIVPDDSIVFECKHGNKSMCLVSNIRETKNIEFAIKLFKKTGWDATIYGNKTSDAYYNKVQTLIDNDPKINIIQGLSNLSSQYNKHSIAIHCGVSETGPLVLLEYLAYGIPFIAYRTGEVANKIADELPMLFMDTFDVDKWCDRIKFVQQEKDLSETLKAVFYKHFSPDKYIEKCLKIYQDINC